MYDEGSFLEKHLIIGSGGTGCALHEVRDEMPHTQADYDDAPLDDRDDDPKLEKSAVQPSHACGQWVETNSSEGY